MPLYQLRCKSCQHDFTELLKVEERNQAKCPVCGSSTELRIGGTAKGFVWKPMWMEHLDTKPVWIESKKQLREECRKRKVDAPCLY
jgi:putative FmdB family regulatory protein